MRQAIGMAVSSHLSLNRSRGGDLAWKAAHLDGIPAVRRAFCALAARQGDPAAVDIFTERRRLLRCTSSQFEAAALGGQHGTPFRIMGAEIKGFPAGYPPHGHRGGARCRAAPADHTAAADIKAIRLFTGPSGMGYASEEACWHPDPGAGRPRPSFLLALALTEGSVESVTSRKGTTRTRRSWR